MTVDLLTRSKEDMAITSVAAEFARTASSQEWVHFFDVLLGEIKVDKFSANLLIHFLSFLSETETSTCYKRCDFYFLMLSCR